MRFDRIPACARMTTFVHPAKTLDKGRLMGDEAANFSFRERDRPDMSKTRTETDMFGPIEVAADKYWGAQAQRSLGNFKIGWERQPLPIVRSLGIVKRAAAEVNMSLDRLDPKLGDAIVRAS